MAQATNQFGQSVEKGMMDLKSPGQMISVILDSVVVPGQAVKLVDSAGGIPHVTAITADTDVVFGFVPFELRRAALAVGDRIELAFFRGGVMYLESSAAVLRGALVMPVLANQQVATATTGKRVVGMTLDKATAANQLIRVLIDVPGNLAP